MTNLDYFVFVGLGNPGPKYEKTRHNIGYLVVRAFAERQGWHFEEESRFQAFVCKGRIEKTMIHLLLPTTYMNLSGAAIKSYLDFFKLEKSQLTVIVDDIALPFGQVRLRWEGSSGGHNGLKSVESNLGTACYGRLRMGIGHPQGKVLANYVLEPFSQIEIECLGSVVDRGATILHQLTRENFVRVMNEVNTIPRLPRIDGMGKDFTNPPLQG